MALPTYKDVDLALLLELVRAGRALRPSETYQLVARHFPEMTEADMAITRADGRTKVFQNTVHWRVTITGLGAYFRSTSLKCGERMKPHGMP